MLVRCTEDQDLVGEKDERGNALSSIVKRSAGKLSQFPSYPLDIDRTAYIAGWQAHDHHRLCFFIRVGIKYTLIKNRVGDDGVPAILQYRPSDLYLTDRKETMAILQKMYPHTSPHLQIRPSLVHPFLSQDKLVIQMHLDVTCNARASCQ